MMKLKEKCEFLAQHNGAVGKLIPLDNPRGGDDYYRLPQEAETSHYHPVCFPSMTNLGMSWNPHMAESVAEYMAKECKARKNVVKWMFRPGMNIKRSPLCGRNFEYVSEDPILTGQIAGHYIRGLQRKGIAACAKHYAVNHQEYQRMTMNAVVSERALKEIYLKAFEEAFSVEKPWSVMTSYNKVNGQWVNSNPMLMNYLRKELKFDGVIVSDWAAVHYDKVEAHRNGMDVETLSYECHSAELEHAVETGILEESVLDRSIERIKKLEKKCSTVSYEETDMEELHSESVRYAADTITLLKNKNRILPLREKENILIVGELAETPLIMGYGSGGMNGYRVDSPLECIRKTYVGQIDFSKGYEQTESIPYRYQKNKDLIEEAERKAEKADKIIIFTGYFYGHETEGRDRAGIKLPKSQEDLIEAMLAIGKPVILVISAGSAVDISCFEQKLDSVLFAGYAGEGFGRAIADILSGTQEPGGRLAETFPMRLEDTPAYLSFTEEGKDNPNVYYGEDIFVGYRYYEKKKMEVLYPFGYGLSYADFEYELLEVKKKADCLEIGVRIKNIGKRNGSAVVQCYVGKNDSIVKRPEKELKTFEKINLDAGIERNIVLCIPFSKLKIYSESQAEWLLEAGIYQIYVGTSVKDIFGKTEISIRSKDCMVRYDRMTPLVNFMMNENFMSIIEENNPQIKFLFDQRTNPHLPLLWALPICRFLEPLTGEIIFTEELIDKIIDGCNKKEND